jgi:hypothetical protein
LHQVGAEPHFAGIRRKPANPPPSRSYGQAHAARRLPARGPRRAKPQMPRNPHPRRA